MKSLVIDPPSRMITPIACIHFRETIHSRMHYGSIHLWYLPSPGASCYFWWFKQYQNHWAMRLLKPVSCQRCQVIWLLGSLKVPSQDTRESTNIIDCWEEPCFSMCFNARETEASRDKRYRRDVGRRYKRLKRGDTECQDCCAEIR